MIKVWLGIHDVHPSDWGNVATVKERWTHHATNKTQSRRPLASLMLLISWELWKERNAQVFRNIAVPVGVVVAKIKEEAALWSIAGAKSLSYIMPRE